MAKTVLSKKSPTGGKIPISDKSKVTGKVVIKGKPISDFKKLHSKWGNQFEASIRTNSKKAECEEITFSKTRTKTKANKENVSDDLPSDVQTTLPAKEELRMPKDGSKRDWLSTRSFVHKEHLKQPDEKNVKKKESVADVEFEVDEQALQSILTNTGVRDTRLLCKTSSILPRNSVYKKVGQEYCAAWKSPGIGPRLQTPLRNSIYQSNIDRPSVFGRLSVAFKSPSRISRGASIQSSRSKNIKPAVRILQSQGKEKPSVKWSDILSPDFPAQSSHCTAEDKSQVTARLFTDEFTPLKSSLKLDMQKLKQIEEVEQQLENEIKQLEMRVVEKVHVNESSMSSCLAASQFLRHPQQKVTCCEFHSNFVPQQNLCSANCSHHGNEIAHITDHLNGICLTPHPCCSSCCKHQNAACHLHHPVKLSTACSCSIIPSSSYHINYCCKSVGIPTVLKHKIPHSNCYCSYENPDLIPSNTPFLTRQGSHCPSVKENVPANTSVCVQQKKDISGHLIDKISNAPFARIIKTDNNVISDKQESFLLKTPGKFFMPGVVRPSIATAADRDIMESSGNSGELDYSDDSCKQSSLSHRKVQSCNSLDASDNVDIKSNLDLSKNCVDSNYQDYNLIRSKLGRESFLLRTCGKSPKSTLGRALINSTTQRFHEALIDEECALYACRLKTKHSPQSLINRDCENPLARVLTEGDAAHFIPVEEQKIFAKSDASAFRSYIP